MKHPVPILLLVLSYAFLTVLVMLSGTVYFCLCQIHNCFFFQFSLLPKFLVCAFKVMLKKLSNCTLSLLKLWNMKKIVLAFKTCREESFWLFLLVPLSTEVFFYHIEFSTFAVHLVLMITSQFLNLLSQTLLDTETPFTAF